MPEEGDVQIGEGRDDRLRLLDKRGHVQPLFQRQPELPLIGLRGEREAFRPRLKPLFGKAPGNALQIALFALLDAGRADVGKVADDGVELGDRLVDLIGKTLTGLGVAFSGGNR